MKHVKTFEQLNEGKYLYANQNIEQMGYDKADLQELENKMKELKEPAEMTVKVLFEFPSEFKVPFKVKSMEDFEKQLANFMDDTLMDMIHDMAAEVKLSTAK